jgi:hypothetical protein
MVLPATITPTTAAASIFPGVAEKYATSYLLRVRSMGTATFVRVGDIYAQSYTLEVVGQVTGWSATTDREIVNLAEIFLISDTADAVIELFATYKDGVS